MSPLHARLVNRRPTRYLGNAQAITREFIVLTRMLGAYVELLTRGDLPLGNTLTRTHLEAMRMEFIRAMETYIARFVELSQ